MAILVTGGAGYIGSHTCVELLENDDQEIIVFDNLCNSSLKSLERVQTITNKSITFVEGDIRDQQALDRLFSKHHIDAVIHFAGLKAVGESVKEPIMYYDNNVVGTLRLLQAMKTANCKKIVFSSSATVYGDPASVPIKENFPTSATNPYGQSKLMIEEILNDVYESDPSWKIAILRYFNPIGAHASGLIGEDPNGIPNNLLPFVSQVAVGLRPTLSVFGGDYPTCDGTGVRDYIHVVDLAKGHLRALNTLNKLDQAEVITVNLGTGHGYSVLQIVQAFEQASGKPVAYQIVDRRPGDIAECFADTDYALQKIGWKAELGIERMCQDAWRWQSQNPNGY
jgi:UDP-glucose 4-epimerase